jgi:hypothetical protein
MIENLEPLSNYENRWSSPRFLFKQNIGNYVSENTLNLTLEEFSESKTLFKSSGFFKVSGNYESVKQFALLLEKEYGEYLAFHADWSYYDSLFN